MRPKGSSGTRIVGVWIALDEVTVENGCMHLLESRNKLGPRVDFKRRDWQISDEEVMGCPAVGIPHKPGGILLFDCRLADGAPHNSQGQRG